MNKKRLLLLITILISAFIGFYPFQTYLSNKIYPRLPINLCFLSYGATFRIDYFSDNREDCYAIRAREKNEWESCLLTSSPGDCLSSLSMRTATFLCDNTRDEKQRVLCSNDLLSGGGDSIHSLSGIEKHKITRSLILSAGDKFLLNPVNISGDKIEFFSHSRYYCARSENPPLRVNTVGGGPNFIFITGCLINNENVIINYFKYDFPGLQFLDDVK